MATTNALKPEMQQESQEVSAFLDESRRKKEKGHEDSKNVDNNHETARMMHLIAAAFK